MFKWLISFLMLMTLATCFAEDPTSLVHFTPPSGWRFAEVSPKMKCIRTMVVGKGSHEVPPTITLGVEKYKGSLKEYIKRLKTSTESQGSQFKDLGTIQTESGTAALVQEDMKNRWGNIRLMTALLLQDETMYLLSSAALQDEFPKFYPEFFRAIRSLKVNTELLAMITDRDRRFRLEQVQRDLLIASKKWKEQHNTEAKTLPEDPEFLTNYWQPFVAIVGRDFADLGQEWLTALFGQTKEKLKSI